MRPILLSAVAVAIVALYAMPAAAQTTDQGTAEIVFEDQTMEGSSVTIARVTLPQGGFVVIHDTSQATQDPNQQDPNQQDPNQDTTGQDIVGFSEYLEAGTHEDVQVTITVGTTGTGDGGTGGDTGNDTGTGTTGTGSELTLTAMLHIDTNNNQQFDGQDGGQEDTPYTENGGTVTDEARVTVDDQGTGDNQTDDGLDQPGDDGFPDDGEDDVVDEEEDTPGFGVVALLAVVGAVAALRRR